MTEHSWTRREFLRRSTLVGVAAGAAPALLAACARTEVGTGNVKGDEDSLEQARKAGFIRVGFANEAPFGFADPAGKLTGEAPEVARAVFKKLDIPEIQGVLTEFGSLIPGLKAGRFDVIAAGMFITPKRCAEIAFSNPDYCTKVAFLVPTGNPNNIQKYEDVAKNSRLRLGVLTGAVEHGYAKDLGVRPAQLTVFPDPPSMIEGIRAGRVDAISLTSISLRDLLSKHKGAKLELTEPFAPVIDGKEQFGCGGYGFRKNDTKAVEAFNDALADLKQSGELLRIIKPFGFTEAEIAGDKTTDELCKG